MHPYRTHTCGALRLTDAGAEVRLSGWVHRKRDHGNLLFVDLRDHYGIAQCVIDAAHSVRESLGRGRRVSSSSPARWCARRPRRSTRRSPPARSRCESTLRRRIAGRGAADAGRRRRRLRRGDLRLRYRFLDLRRERLHRNIVLRSQVIASLRRRMIDAGFLEFQTPILTASLARGRARLSGAEPHSSR